MILKGYVHETIIKDATKETLLEAVEVMFGPKWETEWCVRILRWPDGKAEVSGKWINWNSPAG